MSVGLLKCKVCTHSVITTLNSVYHLVFTGRCNRGKQCIHNYMFLYKAMGDSDSDCNCRLHLRFSYRNQERTETTDSLRWFKISPSILTFASRKMLENETSLPISFFNSTVTITQLHQPTLLQKAASWSKQIEGNNQ